MSNHVFFKELPENVYTANGRPIACDFTDPDGLGWIATSNGYVIHQINQAIAQHIGGFVASDQASYDEALKKKETAPPPSLLQNQRLQSFQPFHLAQQRAAGFVEAGNTSPGLPGMAAPKPDPIAVPTPAQMAPRTGRVAAKPSTVPKNPE